MPVLLFFMRALEVLFFIGVAGSAIVVLLTLLEDLRLLITRNLGTNETTHK